MELRRHAVCHAGGRQLASQPHQLPGTLQMQLCQAAFRPAMLPVLYHANLRSLRHAQVGAYPFEDPQDPRNFRKTIQVRSSSFQSADQANGLSSLCTPWSVLIPCASRCSVVVPKLTEVCQPRLIRLRTPQRIMGVKYSFPSNLQLSRECLDLISQVFVANPANRVTLKGLKQHPWFLQNLPDELKARLGNSPWLPVIVRS